jgi:two-component system sensor histidine kinase/response regulator
LALAALLDRVARGELRPPIDHAARLAKVGGRAELARTIVETFRSHQPTLAEPLDAAIVAGNLEEVRRAAHGLRGALLMVGAVEAAAVADALETAPLVEAKALRPRLHFELARAAAELALA